jgi:hypothetical protein
MTVTEFIIKWRKVELTERSAAQQHFLDLCEVFDHPRTSSFYGRLALPMCSSTWWINAPPHHQLTAGNQ